MRILSRKDIEMIAERVVTQYKALPEITNSQIYHVDPVLLAERVYGFSVEYEHLSVDGRALGVTSYQEAPAKIWADDGSPGYYILDGKTILIEKDLKDDVSRLGQHNFTVGHETAHQILSLLYPGDYTVKVRKERLLYYRAESEKRGPVRNWEEWQANALASSILLPPDLVSRCMYLFGLPDKMRWLNRIYGVKEYEQFTNMAQFLGVSRKAMAIRMEQLGVLEKDYLDDPEALIRVEM
mgnify:CR=1 FL=1